LREKVKLVMAGTCEKCGKEILRPYPADTAFCQCESLTTVPLELAVVLPESLYKKYERIASLARINTKALIRKVLEVGIEEKLKETRK